MSLDHILLGLLTKPHSGYELKAMFDRSLNYFWPAELSHIYRILQRLEDGGDLQSWTEPSPKGPDRRVYERTAAGRRRLRDWLAEGPAFGDERFTYLAQVFFLGEHDDLRETLRFVTELRDVFKARLSTYRRIDREWRSGRGPYPDLASPEGFHQHLTLQMGLHRMRAAVRWGNEVISQINERIANAATDARTERSCQ